MNIVEFSALFLFATSLYLFVANVQHYRTQERVKSTNSINGLRAVSILLLSLQSFAIMIVVVFTSFNDKKSNFHRNGMSNRSFIYEGNRTNATEVKEKQSNSAYKLVNIFFALLYRLLVELMLVSRVKFIFKKVPFCCKRVELRCVVCIYLATFLTTVQFLSHVNFVVIEAKILFLVKSMTYCGNLLCKLYFVRCSLVTFKSFQMLSKKIFNRQRAYVRRMKSCMIGYVINDVTLVAVIGTLKGLNVFKYEGSVIIIVFLFSNCVDFAILLCTYNRWRSILTLYYCEKKDEKSKGSKKSPENCKTEQARFKQKILPMK